MNKPNKSRKPNISRRQFLTAAGGITFVISAYAVLPSVSTRREEGKKKDLLSANDKKNITAWVQLQPDGQITIFNPSAEMGQGSMTALGVLVAEEMDADWSKVHIEHSPVEPSTYGLKWGRGGEGRMITVGSRTVSGYYDGLREAGAQARYILLSNVAGKWSVPIEELTTEPSVVVHKASGRRISYGEIASFAKMPKSLPEIAKSQLKKPEQFRLIGTKIPRFDIPSKVDGSAQFAIDVHLPNMVYGVISRSPVNGAKPKILNEQAIRDTEGIIDIVMLDHGVGLIADSVENALKTKQQLQIQWGEAKAITHNSESAYDDYVKIAADDQANSNAIVNTGNAKQVFEKAQKTYTIDYKNDYVYHAQMEPLNAVVSVAEDGKSAEVWAGTQASAGARSAAARALGIEYEKVILHPCYLGGGFGRRSASDYVEEAALLAKNIRRPLKLIWTREDDLQYGMFRPISLQRMQASLDEAGNINSWRHCIVGPGDRLLASGAKPSHYNLPNQLIEVRSIDHGIRTKHWRAVGHGPNHFAIEAFIDEIARDQKLDPYSFRQKLMKGHPRALKVLDTAAKMANWGSPLKEGRARGIAFGERSGSLSAGVCEISLDRNSGQIKVHHIWASLDAGIVVQPDNAINQMEGSILMGLSSVLSERITFKNGKVQQSNYHDYLVLRFSDIPESIDIEIIPSTENPTGIGEAGLPMVGGAIANAFAALTGKQLRHMPFNPENVLRVLNA